MNPTSEALARKNRALIAYQIVLTLIAALIWVMLRGGEAALAALYGGLVTLASTLLLGWRMLQAGRVAGRNPRKSMRMLYVGALQRFVLVVAAFACGIGIFQLYPPAIIVGFVASQFAYVLVGLGRKRASD